MKGATLGLSCDHCWSFYPLSPALSELDKMTWRVGPSRNADCPVCRDLPGLLIDHVLFNVRVADSGAKVRGRKRPKTVSANRSK
jgi:hypothetical protein